MYPHSSSHLRRFRAVPGGSIPCQFEPGAGEAKWVLETRKQTLHRREVSAGKWKSGQRGRQWEGEGPGEAPAASATRLLNKS